jgi:predicted DsbA family dithiol-disulfide isomerase
MKVEIWSDVACPFCWIGKHHFEAAIEQLGLKNTEIEWRSFELDPHAQLQYDDDLYTLLANKYGQTRDWAVNMANDMKLKGRSIGLEFNFDDTKSTNTFDAHRLLHLAKSKGLQNEAEKILFKAYFKDGKQVGNRQELIEIGVEIGIDPMEVTQTLETDRFATEVRDDEQLGQELGIRGVPFFVVNRKYGISGAQPVEHFVNVLQKARSEEPTLIVEKDQQGESCGIDGCD